MANEDVSSRRGGNSFRRSRNRATRKAASGAHPGARHESSSRHIPGTHDEACYGKCRHGSADTVTMTRTRHGNRYEEPFRSRNDPMTAHDEPLRIVATVDHDEAHDGNRYGGPSRFSTNEDGLHSDSMTNKVADSHDEPQRSRSRRWGRKHPRARMRCAINALPTCCF